jgi:hypothetical protein
MLFKMINAVVIEIENHDGKPMTPMVGYILQDLDTAIKICVSRSEAYEIGMEIGVVNAEAKTREVSCKDDKPNKDGTISYLRLNEKGKKINEILISHNEIPSDVTQTFRYTEDLRMKYGIRVI